MPRAIIFVGLLHLATVHANADIIVSTFDSDLDGWTGDNLIVSHRSTGGNPGGFLFADDLGDASYAVAPTKFLGDLSPFIGGTISFDLRRISGTAADGGFTGTVFIDSASDSASFRILPPPYTGAWQSGSAILEASVWGKSEPAWAALLTGVTRIRVVIDTTIDPNDQAGFDNFRITAVPEPTSILALGSGLLCVLGWERFRRLVRKAWAAEARP